MIILTIAACLTTTSAFANAANYPAPSNFRQRINAILEESHNSIFTEKTPVQQSKFTAVETANNLPDTSDLIADARKLRSKLKKLDSIHKRQINKVVMPSAKKSSSAQHTQPVVVLENIPCTNLNDTVLTIDSIDDVNFDYKITNSSKKFKADCVFTDSYRTFIKIPVKIQRKYQPVLMIRKNNQWEITDYYTKNDLLIVSELFEEAMLISARNCEPKTIKIIKNSKEMQN